MFIPDECFNPPGKGVTSPPQPENRLSRLDLSLGDHLGWSLPPYYSTTAAAATCCLAVPEPTRGHLQLDSKDDLAGMGPSPLLHNQVLRIVKLSFDQNLCCLSSVLPLIRLVPFLSARVCHLSHTPFLTSLWTARNRESTITQLNGHLLNHFLMI